MSDQPVFFPVLAPGGQIVLGHTPTPDNRRWNYLCRSGPQGFKIVAPNQCGVFVEPLADEAVFHFRFTRGARMFRQLDPVNPAVMTGMRVRLRHAGMDSTAVQLQSLEKIFSQVADGETLLVYQWRAGQLHAITGPMFESAGQFMVALPHAPEIFRNSLLAGTPMPDPETAPYLRVTRRAPVVFESAHAGDFHIAVEMIYQDRFARYYYDVDEFFSRLARARRLVVPVGLRDLDPPIAYRYRSLPDAPPADPYLDVLCVPARDYEAEELRSPTHNLITIEGGHTRLRLTIAFRNPEPGGSLTESQSIVVPPEIMRLESGGSVDDASSAAEDLVLRASARNFTVPGNWRYRLIPPATLADPDVASADPFGMEAEFPYLPGTDDTLDAELALSWEAFRRQVAASSTSITNDDELRVAIEHNFFLLAVNQQYVLFDVREDAMRLLENRIIALAEAAQRHGDALLEKRNLGGHDGSYTLIWTNAGALEFVEFLRFLEDSGTGPSGTARAEIWREIWSEIERDWDAGAAGGQGRTLYRGIRATLRSNQIEFDDLTNGPVSVRSVLDRSTFPTRFGAAPPKQRSELLLALARVLGAYKPPDLPDEIGFGLTFTSERPPSGSTLPFLFEWSSLAALWREGGANDDFSHRVPLSVLLGVLSLEHITQRLSDSGAGGAGTPADHRSRVRHVYQEAIGEINRRLADIGYEYAGSLETGYGLQVNSGLVSSDIRGADASRLSLHAEDAALAGSVVSLQAALVNRATLSHTPDAAFRGAQGYDLVNVLLATFVENDRAGRVPPELAEGERRLLKHLQELPEIERRGRLMPTPDPTTPRMDSISRFVGRVGTVLTLVQLLRTLSDAKEFTRLHQEHQAQYAHFSALASGLQIVGAGIWAFNPLAGLFLGCLGFLGGELIDTLGPSASTPVQTAFGFSMFGSQAHLTMRSDHPYHYMTNRPGIQFNRVLSSVLPVDFHKYRLSGALGMSVESPYLAVGGIVCVEFLGSGRYLVFPIFLGSREPGPVSRSAFAENFRTAPSVSRSTSPFGLFTGTTVIGECAERGYMIRINRRESTGTLIASVIIQHDLYSAIGSPDRLRTYFSTGPVPFLDAVSTIPSIEDIRGFDRPGFLDDIVTAQPQRMLVAGD